MTQPYFYIIEHTPSGRKYAGSRWQQGCHPTELLQLDGYCTSSDTVHDIIEVDGLDSFRIVDIIVMENPYEYESSFLRENKCAESDEWFNKHNNELVPPPWGSEEFKQLMMAKYGVEHNTHIPEVRAQMTRKQKEFYKNNPEAVAARARKVADAKIKNGTTGKGIPKNLSDEARKRISDNGKRKRTKIECDLLSAHQKEHSHFVKNNPMNDPEKRKLVSLSKIGKKKYMSLETKEVRMFLPGLEPAGFVLARKST